MVQILNHLGVEYGARDILVDPRIRQVLSGWSEWPTIPQLFVDGKLVGGCDIVTEMYQEGELQALLGGEVSGGSARRVNAVFAADEPLAELHAHLGGGVDAATMWELAHEQGIKLPYRDYWDVRRAPPTWAPAPTGWTGSTASTTSPS